MPARDSGRGRAFDFLSWYRPLTVVGATAYKPAVPQLRGEVPWRLGQAGTCSGLHFKRMELEKIGTVPIDDDNFRRLFPNLRPGIAQADPGSGRKRDWDGGWWGRTQSRRQSHPAPRPHA